MEQAYIEIMVQSLNKKIQVLEEIEKINITQKEILEDKNSDADAFDKTVEEKAALIEQMERLDSGFDKVFERVKEELETNKTAYEGEIRLMQMMIRQLTELSTKLQVQEAQNKELMTQRFTFVREGARTLRTNKKAANQYYQTMQQLNVIEPQFLDNKK